MKLFAITILKVDTTQATEPLVCTSAIDVSEVGFFQRGAAKEFIIFLARTIGKRTPAMSRLQVNEQGNSLYSQSFAGGKLAVCVTCDKEYNSRVAFNLCALVGDKFMTEFRGRWETVDKDNMLTWPELELILKKYQNPAEADQIMKIQNDINNTKTVMVDAIDQVLARGEKIDDLVVRSQDLSDSSKVFYGQAKKTNSWCGGCVVM
jgi:synaptobrevin homolog YKT6